MKALITGGVGFVGSHLAEYLRTVGVDVCIFDNYSNKCSFDFEPHGFNFVNGDILDNLLLKKAAKDCNVIFHLAGLLGTDYLIDFPEQAVRVNILGTINVLNVARDNDATVVFLSLLPQWHNPYMVTKNAAEQFCKIYSNELSTKTIVLKATHIYGGRQKWYPVVKAVPNFILSALEGRPIPIFGSGNQLMDLIHVNDAVRALASCANNQKIIGKSVELGTGVGISVENVAKRIISLCSSNSEIQFLGGRQGEPQLANAFTPANTVQLKTLLNFTPEMDLNTGLSETINWYRIHVLNK